MATYTAYTNGRTFRVETDKQISHVYAVSYTDEQGVDTVRVSKGHATYQHARKALDLFLARLDKQGLPGAGRILEAVAA